MTKGEYRVGTTFNPSKNSEVDEIKRLAAALIDKIAAIDDVGEAEIARCKALGMTTIEEGAMWGVKAATKEPPKEE